ncbi:MAG TPA: hypothetical protein VK638_17085, partial [Edaphobacter sp.]|nr:hypothetical protein [Edaphobacter sp.]
RSNLRSWPTTAAHMAVMSGPTAKNNSPRLDRLTDERARADAKPRDRIQPHTTEPGFKAAAGGFVPLGERYWPLSISVKPSLVPLIPAMVPFGSYLELSSAIDTSALVLACFDPQ